MPSTNKPAQKQLVFGYLDKEDKPPLPVFLKTHKMQKRTFYLLEGEYKAEKSSLTKREQGEHKEQLSNTVMDAWARVEGREPPKRTSKGYEIVEISGDERLALARKVYMDAMSVEASAKDKDLAVRMLGMLIEKKEIQLGLTADETTRRNLEAERQLRESGYRVEEVQEEPALLSE